MLEFPRWKYALILLVVLVSALYALPNIYPQDPSVQVTASRGAVVDEALRARVEQVVEKAGARPKAVEGDDRSLLVRLPDLDAQTRAADALRAELGDDYVVALNLAPTVPGWLTALGAKPMLLGLDLQGGVHFMLQVDQQVALDKVMNAAADQARAVLRENRIRYQSVERRGDATVVAVLSSEDDAARASSLLATDLPNMQRETSGNRITLRLPESEVDRVAIDAITQNITTLRNRVDEIGVAEPVIQRQGDDRVVVQLPGVQDTAEAKRMIGATATLEYRAVVEGNAFEAVSTGNVPPNAAVYYRRA
jgi:preprotein translocase subunit SecD